MRKAAQLLGIPDENLRVYILRRPHLKERIYAMLPSQHNYPSDERLVELMRQHRNYKDVAKACGVRRESLRDYLARRPELKDLMERHSIRRDWEARTPEEREAIDREQKRRSKAKQQKQSPEKIRAINRQWAKNQAPEKRARWNNHNRHRRLEAGVFDADVPAHLYRDPCSYCGEDGGTVDHIIPVVAGGSSEEANFTAACRSCNASKNDRGLLTFLLSRR